jgi:hypothetical protein
MAKKKAAKKAPRKAAKKPTHKRSKSRAKAAGSVETITPDMIDVTKEVKADVVPVSTATQQTGSTTLPPAESAAKHDEFTQGLTQEPQKRGFWARLFGK